MENTQSVFSRPYSWICFLREKKRFVKHKTIEDTLYGIFEEKSLIFFFPITTLHLYKFENGKNENAVSSVQFYIHIYWVIRNY